MKKSSAIVLGSALAVFVMAACESTGTSNSRGSNRFGYRGSSSATQFASPTPTPEGFTDLPPAPIVQPTPVATPIKNAEDSTPAMGLQNALEKPQETPASTPALAPSATPTESPASTPEVTVVAPVEVPAATPAATPEAPVEAPAATPLN